MSTNQANAMAFALTVAQRLFGPGATAHRLWSVVNDVYLLDTGEATGGRIVKFNLQSSDEILREQQILRSLLQRGLAVPPIEAIQDHLPAFTVMPCITRRNLGELLHAEATSDWVRKLAHRSGQFLAQLHAIDPATVAGALSPQEAAREELRVWQEIQSRLAERNAMDECLAGIMHRAGKLLRRPRAALVNRDFHPGNILADESNFCVVDWGNAGYGFAMRDLARCLAATQTWFCHPLAILDGYQATAPLDADSRIELADWYRYSMLDFAAHGADQEMSVCLNMARAELLWSAGAN